MSLYKECFGNNPTLPPQPPNARPFSTPPHSGAGLEYDPEPEANLLKHTQKKPEVQSLPDLTIHNLKKCSAVFHPGVQGEREERLEFFINFLERLTYLSKIVTKYILGLYKKEFP